MLLAAEEGESGGSGQRRLPPRRGGRRGRGEGGGARAPSLISVRGAMGVGCCSGDMMIDGVSRQGAAARFFEAGPRGERGRQGTDGSGPRASAGGLMRAPGPRRSDRGECLVAERAQGVMSPASDLAGDGERGPVTAEAVGDLAVVGVVGRARAGGALGRLEQRPAQQR